MSIIFTTAYNGESHIVRAPGLRALREHVLREIGFTHARATAADVTAHVEAGGKIVTVEDVVETES